ncbi:MAG: FAD-dependent monooxygenase [Pseudomonadota bacterium]
MTTSADYETDVLVVGTGPAGGGAAALLATYGVNVMVINRFAWTARTPRAHITNQRTMEVIRDLGLEEEANSLAAPQEQMGENTYCASLAGKEFGRIQTWGTHPRRKADYDLASPTKMCDLPQNLLEPVLARAAAHRGAKVRFDTEYISHSQDEDGVSVVLRDVLTDHEYTVRCQYLLGADGANSKIVGDADLPLEGVMAKSGSINIVFEADLTKYVAHRPSVLYWVIQPGSQVGGLGIGVVRMVRPWKKWLAIWGYDVEQGPPDMTDEKATEIVHNLIGDSDIPVKIDATSTWTVNETYATQLSRGRVFALGDAIHRHPPTNGLGSNTSIQDAFNLAWKLAYVIKGKAGPELLETYSTERAPVAEQIVKRANKSLGDFPPILQALGLFDAKTPDDMLKNIDALASESGEAAARRQALHDAIAGSDYVYNAHGVELNQRYDSAAVVPDGSPEEVFARDKELYHQATSRPGANVPHAWLSTPGGRVSTIDLCGKGKFTILTGVNGGKWAELAEKAGAACNIDIDVHQIGLGQHHEDPYGDFAAKMETQEDGALLVRPDLIVAWRAQAIEATSQTDLIQALEKILACGDKAAMSQKTAA